jgi:DNA mismatch endonuclease, patch repair protein
MRAAEGRPKLPEVRFDATPKSVRAVMRGNRSVDTKPELALRSLLHRQGLRFRTNFQIRVGGPRGIRPDIVFTRQRVAIFVDGCFWHGCPEHGELPVSNREYWQAKFTLNAKRDRRNDEALVGAGWQVVRVWEHDSAAHGARAVRAALHAALHTGGSAIELG